MPIGKLLVESHEDQRSKGTDTLASNPMLTAAALNAVTIGTPRDLIIIHREVESKSHMKATKEALSEESATYPHYEVQQGQLQYKVLLALPKTSSLQASLHDTSGQAGYLNVYKKTGE